MRFIKGHLPWNKGLTKENNLSLKIVSEKVSKKRKGTKNPGFNPWQYFKNPEKVKERMSDSKVGNKSALGHKWSEKEKERMSVQRSGKNHHMYGKHFSEESKEKMRKTIGNKLSGKNNPRYGKVPSHGKRIWYNSPFQREVCFHSSWELAYANYLYSINEPWYYEFQFFPLSNGSTYTPDFFLPAQNKYIEIKCYWRDDAKDKFELFRREYPDVNIVLLTKEGLTNMRIL